MMEFENLIEQLAEDPVFDKLSEYADQERSCCSSD